MEEILVPIACQDEAETLVRDEPFDRAVHRSHAVSFTAVDTAVEVRRRIAAVEVR
jgi:hypothetical protein